MAKLKCVDGTLIHYRLPNVIELFQLKDKCGFAREGKSGFAIIAGVLANCSEFIDKVEGQESWEACLEKRNLSDDLAKLASSLIREGVDEEVKKPSKQSGKT